MTYKTRCNGNCIERLEAQAGIIKRERKSRMELFSENSELKERIRYLESQIIEQRLSVAKGEEFFG